MPIEGELALQILRDVIQGESVEEMREVGILSVDVLDILRREKS
jgi:hypothetical protein